MRKTIVLALLLMSIVLTGGVQQGSALRKDEIRREINIPGILSLIQEQYPIYTHRDTLSDWMLVYPPFFNMALADITEDGIPEIFIGLSTPFGLAFYSAYTQDLAEIKIGFSTNMLSGKPIALANDYLLSEFLGGRVYTDKNKNKYYVAFAYSGKLPTPDEYFTTKFWNDNGEWISVLNREWGDVEPTIDDPYEPLPTAQIVSSYRAIGDPDNLNMEGIKKEVERCIDLYMEQIALCSKNSSSDNK